MLDIRYFAKTVMSSLQDQLLKAGLVDQKKVAKANRDKTRKDNLARKNKSRKNVEPTSQPNRLDKKSQRDRELNQQRQEAARRKELAAQAKQLIEDNKQDRTQGEHPYGFVYKNKVKKIFVTEAQKKQLVLGQLAIVTYVTNDGRKFELVPGPVGEKIAQRDTTCSVEIQQQEESEANADDSYADYPVPDDLTW